MHQTHKHFYVFKSFRQHHHWLINLFYAICRTCHMYLFHRNKLLAVLVVWQGLSLLAQWPAMRVASWNNRYRVSRYLMFCHVALVNTLYFSVFIYEYYDCVIFIRCLIALSSCSCIHLCRLIKFNEITGLDWEASHLIYQRPFRVMGLSDTFFRGLDWWWCLVY